MNARLGAVLRLNAHRIAALMSLGKPFTFAGIRFARRPSNLSYEGGGRICVDAKGLVRSEAFKQTLKAIRELRHAICNEREKP